MRKRNHRIQVRLNDKEYAKFLSLINSSGLTSESYIRQLINGVTPKDKPPPEYHLMMKELNAIGNNTNQIALVANATGIIDEDKYDIRNRELNDAILKIMKAVTEPE